jgi:hypothetical protein
MFNYENYDPFDANDRMAGLTESIRLLERIKDEIAGMGYAGLEDDVNALLEAFDDERRDLQDDVLAENEMERMAEEREYYANCY